MSPVKSPEELSVLDTGKQDKIAVESDEAEELPPGWRKEVKRRKTGSATKVDRYYTDPVTGYVFRSLKDAQRYIKTGKLGRLAIKPKMVESEEPSELKEQMSETLRQKREPTDKSELHAHASKRLASINIDAVLPPTSPSLSRSQTKTRQATRLAGLPVDAPPLLSPAQPKTRQAIRLAEVAVEALPPPSPPDARTNHQATRQFGSKIDASISSPSPTAPKTRQAIRLAEMAVEALPPPSPPDARTNHQVTRQSGSKIDASVSSPSPAPKTRQAPRQAGIKIDSPPALPPNSNTLQAISRTGTEIGPSPPSQPEPKTRQAKRVSGIRDNASPASPQQPKTRRATRQAGIKINSPALSPPDTRTSRQATGTKLVKSATPKENDKKTEAEKITDKHNQIADLNANPNHNPGNSITVPQLDQESNGKQEQHNEHNQEIAMKPAPFPPHVDQATPTDVVTSVNLQKQELPVVNPTISNPIPQASYGSDMKPDSSINFSMNDFWTDPCIEFAVKTLTGAIPITDLNKVENFTAPLQVPLEDIWTDPCIEFAVKTLTGAIPVGEDDHIPHRPASSTNPQDLHQFSSHEGGINFCQTDVLSNHYETGHKNKQQESMFPTLGNGGLQKSGKFVNGSNGQSSRSRFFQ